LLAERDPKTNKKFSVEEIIGDMQDLLLAGHETTSNTVAFVLFLLSKFPLIQTQVQEESDKFSDSPSYDDASKMRLIDSVIKETLRLYPAAPLVARTAICDTEVDGIPTKKILASSLVFGVLAEIQHCFESQKNLTQIGGITILMQRKMTVEIIYQLGFRLVLD